MWSQLNKIDYKHLCSNTITVENIQILIASIVKSSKQHTAQKMISSVNVTKSADEGFAPTLSKLALFMHSYWKSGILNNSYLILRKLWLNNGCTKGKNLL